MKDTKHINTPLTDIIIDKLKAGEEVLLSGTIYTARDQAHLKISEIMDQKKKMPINLDGQIIYYCGPILSTDLEISSCGPTTSSRMDKFTPRVLASGVKGMIGKGRRSEEVREAIKEFKAIYFITPGGAGAYLSERVLNCKPVAFEELGPEAIYELEVENFPLIVEIDSAGNDIYENLGSSSK